MAKEDDIGWDVDNPDDDNMDIEGSSTSFKKTSIFSNIKKDKKGDKSDHYHELIEFLKKQYSHFKKQLESIRNSMKKRMERLEETIGSADPNIKELFNTVKKSVEVLEHKQRYRLLTNYCLLFPNRYIIRQTHYSSETTLLLLKTCTMVKDKSKQRKTLISSLYSLEPLNLLYEPYILK